MGKYMMLAANNIRKRKKQTIVIFILIIAAACMMNLWLMLSGDYKANFDRQHDRLHAEHVTLMFNSDDDQIREFTKNALKQNQQIDEYRLDDVLFTYGDFKYNGGSVSMNILFMKEETAFQRNIGQSEVIEKASAEKGVYLPILYGNDENLKLGNDFHMTVSDQELSFPIIGYTNNIMNGSNNCLLMILPVDETLYQELSENPLMTKSTFVSVRSIDKQYAEALEASLNDSLTAEYPQLTVFGNYYQMVSSSRYISQMVCAAVLSAMAFIVLLIVMFVIVANIITDIQENMTALGILKAIGYQSKQIIFVYLLQLTFIAVSAGLIGASLTYCLFPIVNDMMVSQTGIPYYIHFLPIPFIITIVFITSVILAAVYVSVHKIKRLDPILSLRQGIHIHNFRKNYFPFTKTKLSLLSALSLKTAATQTKQNIIVCITTFMLTLVIAFSVVMSANIIFDQQPFIDMVVGESADACIGIDAIKEKELNTFLAQDSRVEKSYLFYTTTLRHESGLSLMVTVSDDFNDLNNQSVCVEGRLPHYENETAVAIKYAQEHQIDIGDEITYSMNGKQADFIVSGYTQLSNNLGKDCFLTRQGYERMGKLTQSNYYLNVKDDVNIEAFLEDVRDTFHEHVKATVDIQAVIEATGDVYIALMTLIVLMVALLSILIVVLVLYLLVRTLLNQKQYDYGIMKALGFTTRQLVIQTAMSFMPVVIISTIIGSVVNSCLINPLASLFLSNIGIVKCMFAIPYDLITLFAVVLVVLTFIVICIMSLRIKHITPKALLSGE